MTTDIEQRVSETFDELFMEINSAEKFHPSEKHNEIRSVSNLAVSKNYVFINAYHGFCKICNQHFYTRSVIDDINSFFQKHINTSYHRQLRKVEIPPDDLPVFTWEKELQTGRCHVCDMSGLNAYVLDTKYVIAWLMKVHRCVCDPAEANHDYFRKLNLLKKYCGTKIFREKTIITMNGKNFCLMCETTIPWSVNKSVCHLNSDLHFFRFCEFLKNQFSFAPKDAFNGFNLERITRWMLIHNFKLPQHFLEQDERAVCLELSNNEKYPYPEGDNCSFSPIHIEDWIYDENSDLIFMKSCLLCNVAATPWHMNSKQHQSKAKTVTDTSIKDSNRNAIFWKNRLKRQQIIRNYTILLEGLKQNQSTETPQEDGSETNFLRVLIDKKLQSVDLTFTLSDFGEIYCEVCDSPGITEPDHHIDSRAHLFQKEIWTSVREMYKNERLIEPFKEIRKVIICFLCGVVLKSNTFFSHLKSVTHLYRFENYLCMRGPPISESFEMRNGFPYKCNECGLELGEKPNLANLKGALKKVSQHWPCPNRGRVVEHGIDFSNIENAIESLVSVFEEKILERVTERTLRRVRSSGSSSGQTKLGIQISGCRLQSPCSCNKKPDVKIVQNNQIQDKRTDRVEKEVEKVEVNENDDVEVDDVDVDDVDNGELDEEDEEKRNVKENEDQEVLVIKGLQKSRQLFHTIYANFKVFGKISFVVFRGCQAYVTFAQKGVAKQVCTKGSTRFLEDKLTFHVTTRGALGETDKKRTAKPLNKDLASILESDVALMECVTQLDREAEKASNSHVEKNRQEAVCWAIIWAVYKDFPNGRCYPFGSRLSGLVLKDSDLDVFLDCGGMYDGFKCVNSLTEKGLVNKVAKMLRKNPEIKVNKVVDRARVPIVSFLHRPTLINCDLSFKNGLSIQNTLLIKLILSLDPRVRPLILFLKYWAKVNNLHGPSFFSSYAIVMLVVFYLQQVVPPVLPTIELLQNGHNGPRTTIAGWDCSIDIFPSDYKSAKNHKSFLVLLNGFFNFYAEYDYKQNIISPLTGSSVPREFFNESGFTKLPLCYKRQVLNLPQPIENLANEKYFICLIDPFDLSHNLTKRFTFNGLEKFKHYCILSGELMRKKNIEREE